MKIIRWWGVVAFFVLVVLLTVAWYLLAPVIIKGGIESAATKTLGAKVEIDQLKLSLFPVGVEIERLQATDPDQPMKNMFEVGHIKFTLDSDALFWKKIQIDELDITHIQLGTDRANSGVIVDDVAIEQTSEEVATVDLPELNDEDIKLMVAKADLVTLKRLKELDESQQIMQKYWKKELESDEGKERIQALEIEYKRLAERAKKNKMNILTDRKDWKKLKKAISNERKRIQQMNEQYKTDKGKLKQQIADVRAGPSDDLKAVMSDLGLGNGISGLSDKFLGPTLTPWVKKLVGFMRNIKSDSGGAEEAPVYSTEKGQMVQFKDNQLFPDVLIKKINLSGKNDSNELSGRGTNLGYFPWLVGQPAVLDLNITGTGKAIFSLKSNWQSEQQMLTRINSKVDHWRVTHFELMKTDLGSWVVNSGELNAKLAGELSFEKVNLNLNIQINKAKISAPTNLSGWQKTLASSLNQQRHLNMELKVTGTIDKPKFKINSSLDKLFSNAIGQKVQQQSEKLIGKFNESISARVGDLDSLDQYYKDLAQWSEKLNLNDDLLKNFKLKL